MSHVAAKPDRERLAGHAVTGIPPAHRASNPEIGAPVRHLGELREHPARLRERLIDIPQRARPADTREMEVGRRLTLGDIAGPIDPDEEERHAPSFGPLEG